MSTEQDPFALAFASFMKDAPLLSELTRHVTIGNKWFILGNLLGLDIRSLEEIERQSINDSSKTLKMFGLWLGTTPTGSRRDVLKALRENAVGENTVAEKYEQSLGQIFIETHPKYKIEELERIIKQKDKELIAAANRIQELEATIKEKDKLIDAKKELENVIIQKDKEIFDLKKELRTKEESEEIISKKDERITDLEKNFNQLSEKYEECAELQENMKWQLSSLDELLQDRLEELRVAQTQLESSQHSLDDKNKTNEVLLKRILLLEERSLVENETINQLLQLRLELLRSVGMDIFERPGKVSWHNHWVRLDNPLADQCCQAISNIKPDHSIVIILNSFTEIAQLLAVPLLHRNTIKRIEIKTTPLSQTFISSFITKLPNKSLQELVLNGDSITDAIVLELARLLSQGGLHIAITHLDISHNPGITCTGAKSLASMLRVNGRLHFLYLSNTSVQYEGAYELLESMRCNTTLKTLRINKTCESDCISYAYYQLVKHKITFL